MNPKPTNTGDTIEEGTESGSLGPDLLPMRVPANTSRLTDSLPTDVTQRYRAGDLLGRGGMGEVRAFHDRWIGRDVAVKTVRRERNAATLKRFLREARVQGQIEHPAIVPVYDLGEDEDGTLRLTMRCIRGRTLHEILRGLAVNDTAMQVRFSRRRLLEAFVRVCLAVDYAHQRGVVHRDLKPRNIMFGDFGEVYVLDWGIAKLTGIDDTPTDVASPQDDGETRGAVGTPGYMSPEQARGESGRVDGRSDVYSLGVLLFEMLTTQALHPRGPVAETILSTFEGTDARPSARGADVPPELDAVCVRATALAPADRFKTARELSNAIERYLDGDRDLERRRELAADHAAKAAEILHASPTGRETDAPNAEAQSAAMREVVASLALDPEQAQARTTLVRMLVDVPDALPKEAEAEMRRSWSAERVRAVRLARWGYLTWLPCIVAAWLMGVRNPVAFWSTTALAIACGVFCFALARRPSVTTLGGCALGALTFVATAFFSTWLGPFVLVPVATACSGVLFCFHADRTETRIILALIALTVVAPFIAEWVHLVPMSYSFSAGDLVLYARAVNHGPGITTAALVYTSVAFSLAPPLFFLRQRQALRRAERKLFLHSWHLNHLLSASR